jgi:hypothetical protein
MISLRKDYWEKEPIIYDYPEKFDCHIISMKNFKGGSYFSGFPFSSLDYAKQEENAMRFFKRGARKIIVCNGVNSTIFVIYDDWASEYIVNISNEHKEVIDKAIKNAREQELLVSKEEGISILRKKGKCLLIKELKYGNLF